MEYRKLMTAAAAVLSLPLLTGCSGYSGIAAVQRTAEAKDDLPASVRNVNPDLPSDFRFLAEDANVKYFAAESPDHTTACIAVYPVDKPDQWVTGCSGGITGEREIVTSSHTGQPTVKLVTTGFDTRSLESEGWRKIHDNVLVGTANRL